MRLYQMFNNFLFVDFHFLYTHENYRSTVLYNQKYVKNFSVFLILFWTLILNFMIESVPCESYDYEISMEIPLLHC